MLPFQDYFSEEILLAGIFPTFLHKLYDKDVLDELIILKWYNAPVFAEDSTKVNEYKKLRENEVCAFEVLAYCFFSFEG